MENRQHGVVEKNSESAFQLPAEVLNAARKLTHEDSVAPVLAEAAAAAAVGRGDKKNAPTAAKKAATTKAKKGHKKAGGSRKKDHLNAGLKGKKADDHAGSLMNIVLIPINEDEGTASYADGLIYLMEDAVGGGSTDIIEGETVTIPGTETDTMKSFGTMDVSVLPTCFATVAIPCSYCCRALNWVICSRQIGVPFI